MSNSDASTARPRALAACPRARVAPGIVRVDVSEHMPGGWPRRDIDDVGRIYVHHSGALGPPGLAGAFASARYVVAHRGYAGAAYHYWLPYEPCLVGGDLALLQLVHVGRRCWHTGGEANTHGVGLALQGNTTARPMSQFQIELLEGLLPWLRHQLPHQLAPWLSWHSESGQFGGSGKPSCPGEHATDWLRRYRRLS